MKSCLYISLLLITSGCAERNVFVCESDQSVKYHYKVNCIGIQKCRYKIVEISIDSAMNQGKSLCSWEN